MKAKRSSNKPAAQPMRPEIRELYKTEKPRSSSREFERALLNLVRKVGYERRLEVYCFAEALVMSCIKARQQRRAGHAA